MLNWEGALGLCTLCQTDLQCNPLVLGQPCGLKAFMLLRMLLLPLGFRAKEK